MTEQLTWNSSEIAGMVARYWWPLLRIAGFMTSAPIVSSSSVPARTRIALSIALAVIVAPLASVPADESIFSGAGLLIATEQFLIGFAIGTIVQLVFDALLIAAQIISMTMGLGYANLIDPQHGDTTAVLGKFFTVLATLAYLAADGHLALIGAFVRGFSSMPIAPLGVDRSFLAAVAGWGAGLYESGILIALPATVALIVVNLALGVVTRAAPQLNLFSVGFPATMLAGFFVLIVSLGGLIAATDGLVRTALGVAADIASGPGGGPH